jgi:hypothetical protein
MLGLGLARAAYADSVSLGFLTIPADPQKCLLVNGVALSGTVEARYEHGGATLGGVEWFPVPRPVGFMSPPRGKPDPSELSPKARDMIANMPEVSRNVREGRTLDEAIADYLAAQESTLVRTGGSDGSFAPPPTPAQQAAWLRERAEGQLRTYRTFLSVDGPVFLLSTSGTDILAIGQSATNAFDELERMKAAKTKAGRDRLRMSMKVIPERAWIQMETTGYFDRRD